jgi:hypothetical protein
VRRKKIVAAVFRSLHSNSNFNIFYLSLLCRHNARHPPARLGGVGACQPRRHPRQVLNGEGVWYMYITCVCLRFLSFVCVHKLCVLRKLVPFVRSLYQTPLSTPTFCSYYLTSIYDHSIFEAFSKVVQKLIRQVRIETFPPFFLDNRREKRERTRDENS